MSKSGLIITLYARIDENFLHIFFLRTWHVRSIERLRGSVRKKSGSNNEWLTKGCATWHVTPWEHVMGKVWGSFFSSR